MQDEWVSQDLKTVSWQVHKICGFSISSSSESNSDIVADTLIVLHSCIDDDDVSRDDMIPVDDWSWWSTWCWLLDHDFGAMMISDSYCLDELLMMTAIEPLLDDIVLDDGGVSLV